MKVNFEIDNNNRIIGIRSFPFASDLPYLEIKDLKDIRVGIDYAVKEESSEGIRYSVQKGNDLEYLQLSKNRQEMAGHEEELRNEEEKLNLEMKIAFLEKQVRESSGLDNNAYKKRMVLEKLGKDLKRFKG